MNQSFAAVNVHWSEFLRLLILEQICLSASLCFSLECVVRACLSPWSFVRSSVSLKHQFNTEPRTRALGSDELFVLSGACCSVLISARARARAGDFHADVVNCCVKVFYISRSLVFDSVGRVWLSPRLIFVFPRNESSILRWNIYIMLNR